ncbi:MAG: hypothetical protein WBD81_18030 [Collimonas pratensis]|uniref:hypothetical protein n=1 Tax=Collimonas pratensis TaxID=279113 RepID=UPI003C751EC4
MANLTVSTAVDTLMQATDQSDLQAAVGLTPGVAAGDVVQLNDSAQLPAVDGSLLTNLPGVSLPISVGPDQAIINYGLDSILSTDGSVNPVLQGYNSGTPEDIISFSSTGIASITAASDGMQLPITRTVGRAVITLSGNSVAPLSFSEINAIVSGSLETDSVSVVLDSLQGGSGLGAIILAYVVWNSFINGFTLAFFNTDPTNTNSLTGNAYITATR